MKLYYYFEGIDKYGPFTEEELLQKQLSDDSLVVDSETNESMRYADFKLQDKCFQADEMESATKIDSGLEENHKPKRPWKSVIKVVAGILVVAAFIVPKFLATYYKNKAESAVREIMEEKYQINDNYKTYKDGNFSFKYPAHMSIIQDEMIADRRSLVLSSNESDCALMVFYSDMEEIYEFAMKEHIAYTELNTNSKKAITNIYPNAHFGDIYVDYEKSFAIAKMDLSFNKYKGKSYSFVGNDKACLITYFGDNSKILNTIDKYINELVIE